MTTLIDLIPDYEVFLKVEPEQVASRILRLMNGEGPRPNRRGFTMIHSRDQLYSGPTPYPQEFADEIFRAVAEAWNWLEVQGLIVWPDDLNGRDGYRVPSRRGEKLVDEATFERFLAGVALPREFMHLRLRETAWLLFLSGDYDTAVFKAFKEVEIAVRNAAGLPEADYGVTLMRKAFAPSNGALTDHNALKSEQEALSSLFAGAIGYHKNPQSHQDVGLTDAAEAREMIMLASHLLRIVGGHASSLVVENNA